MFRFDQTADLSPSTSQANSRMADPLCLFAAAFPFVIGSLVLLGWSHDVELLKRSYPSFVAMNPVTAFCLIMSGIAIGLIHFRRGQAAIGVAGVVSVITGAKLLDVAFGGLPVDQFLFTNLLDVGRDSQPNRMAPNTALALFVAGLALSFAASRRPQLQRISQVLGGAVLLISMFAMIGYAFGIDELQGVGQFIPMALHTGAALFVVGAGIVSLSPQVGLMQVIQDPGPAGVLARFVIPLSMAIPIVIGSIRLWGEHQAYYGTEVGVALMVTVNVIVTLAMLIPTIFALSRSDCSRRAREQALTQSEHFNRSINEASPDCVSLLDPEGNVLYVNDSVVRAHGLKTSAPLLGRPWGSQLNDSVTEARNAALTAAREGGVGRVTVGMPGVHGEQVLFESLISKLSDADGQAVRFLVISRDVTVQRKVEHEVRWRATHDALTELPNRTAFQAQLDQITEGKSSPHFAILMLDIDDFKQVNDTLGHDAGDALLVTIGHRLRKTIRAEDFVARLGGDEFAIILDGVRSQEGAISAGEKVLENLKEPWVHNRRVGDCRTSLGISIAGLHGDTPSELLKNADIALYVAKAQERGRLAIFSAEMRAKMQERASKISLARDALQDDLIVPFYQPKVDLKTRKLVGFEALLRWRHPTRGVQLPATIDAAFEDVELAQELTDRILTHVLEDMRSWIDAGVDFGHVAVNTGAADFKHKDFAKDLLARLDVASIPTSCLQVEVTETVFLGRGAEYVERALKTLSASAVRIALDDFGTGYASLSHLKQFPVDIVKIDRSFLKNIHTDEHNAAIIRTVASLGRALDLEVVAEGVETADQEAYLIAQGCGVGQGYFYGKAAPASRIPDLIDSRQKRLSNAA